MLMDALGSVYDSHIPPRPKSGIETVLLIKHLQYSEFAGRTRRKRGRHCGPHERCYDNVPMGHSVVPLSM